VVETPGQGARFSAVDLGGLLEAIRAGDEPFESSPEPPDPGDSRFGDAPRAMDRPVAPGEMPESSDIL
jgi:hypothetical protein